MTTQAVVPVPVRGRAGRRTVPLVAGAGCALALAVALVAVGHTAETLSSPLEPDTDAWRSVLVAGIAGAFVLYLLGLAFLRRRVVPLAAVAVVAVAIQLAPLAAPLLLSRDTYVYWDYGRIATVHHGNPYADLPDRWPLDPAYARMGADWHRTYDAYGPAWTLVAEGGARLAGSSAHAEEIFSKVVGGLGALAMVAAAAFAAPRRHRSFAAGFVGWNPLLALHFAGGGHNDAWMMAFALAAVGLTDRRRELAGGLAWMGGIAIKWLPLLFLPFELLRLRGGRRRRLIAGLAIGTLIGAALSSAFFGAEWIRAVIPVSNQLRRSSSISSTYWLAKAGISEHHATIVLAVLFAVAYLWLCREAFRGRPRRGLAAGLFCLSLSWLTPWYAAWPLAFAAIEEDLLAQGLALALSAWLLKDALPV
ncbi:MAG TPA: glycosyltransferase 87 family protein [Gaiellaceae bacterium]